MSKARRVTDAERTATMLDLVHQLYNEEGPEARLPPRHVVVDECATGTGFRFASRYADAMALCMWPSDGLSLHGYEIKASRADLRKELADLSKHEAIARYCDTWTLVAYDESVLPGGTIDISMIPESWGIMLTRGGERHGYELYTVRRAAKRSPLPWPREFVCSLVRNAYQQSPGAAYVARVARLANIAGRQEGETIARGDARHALRPLIVALYGKDEWKWPANVSKDIVKLAELAAKRLLQGELAGTP